MAKVILRKWNGTIKVIVHKDGKRWVSSTNVNVADKYWKNDHLLPSCPDYTLCNNQIMAVYNNIIAADIRVRNKGEEPTVKAVRSEYKTFTNALGIVKASPVALLQLNSDKNRFRSVKIIYNTYNVIGADY